MKSIRRLIAVLALTALLPATGSAQEGKLFKDSWFWGAKAGVMTFWTTRVAHAQAPLFGADWLITRSKGALLVSGEQGFFEEKSSVFDPSEPDQQRTVAISNIRRATFTLLGFPKQYGALRPYVGLGVAYNFIQKASPVGLTSGSAQSDTISARVRDEQSSASPVFMIGLQGQVRRFSIFGQGSLMYSQNRLLFNNNETYVLEGGIRYNIGSSIDRPN